MVLVIHGHFKEIWDVQFLLVGGFNPSEKHILLKKWVHLPQIGVNMFQKKWVATTFRTEFLIFLVSPPKKSSHAAWSGANLRTPMVWTGCSQDHPKAIYRKKLRFGWKIKISKPLGIPPAILQAEIMISFYSLSTAIKAAQVGNGRKHTNLVGGFNPFEKFSQIGSPPQVGVK